MVTYHLEARCLHLHKNIKPVRDLEFEKCITPNVVLCILRYKSRKKVIQSPNIQTYWDDHFLDTEIKYQ